MVHRELISSPGSNLNRKPGQGSRATGSEAPARFRFCLSSAIIGKTAAISQGQYKAKPDTADWIAKAAVDYSLRPT